MFNIGGGELIVIMLLALIVLGPTRLPEAARQVGKAMADLRRLSTGFQNEVRTALDSVDDTDRVTARRNVLAKEMPPGEDEAPSHPVGTDPLTAAPGVDPVDEGSTGAPEAPPPSARSRAAARKQAAAKRPATTAREESATNGTPVESVGPASPDPAPRPTI